MVPARSKADAFALTSQKRLAVAAGLARHCPTCRSNCNCEAMMILRYRTVRAGTQVGMLDLYIPGGMEIAGIALHRGIGGGLWIDFPLAAHAPAESPRPIISIPDGEACERFRREAIYALRIAALTPEHPDSVDLLDIDDPEQPDAGNGGGLF